MVQKQTEIEMKAKRGVNLANKSSKSKLESFLIFSLSFIFLVSLIAATTLTITSPFNGGSNSRGTLFNVSSPETASGLGFIIPNIDNSLVSWLKLESGNGTLFVDQTGVNNMTCSGTACPTYDSAGKFGGAYSFDGSNDFVASPSIATTQNISIFSWIKPANVAGPEQHFFAVPSGNANQDPQIYKSSGSGSLNFVIFDGTHRCIGDGISLGTISNGIWAHLGYTRLANYSGSYSNYTLYKNGLIMGSRLCNGTLANASIQLAKKYASSYYFNGSMDNVIIFNKSLTSDEIKAIYNASRISHTETLAEGSHNYKVYSGNSSGTITTQEINLTIDTFPPVISFQGATPSSSSTLTTHSVVVNTTSSSQSPRSSFINPPTTAARNESDLAVGMTFQVSSPILVSQLGRLYVSGNSQDHYIALWDSDDQVTPIASGTVLASSASDSNNFKWVSVTPVTLVPGKTYAIAIDENADGDAWKDIWSINKTLDSVFTTISAAYYLGQSTYPSEAAAANTMYDTPAMKYTVNNYETNHYSFLNLDNSLVGFWRFENSTSAIDESGYGNNGTLVGGVTQGAGKFGSAYEFDGVDDCVNIPNSNSLDISGDITISAWVKPTFNSNGDGDVLEKGGCGGYLIWAATDTYFQFDKQCDGGSVVGYDPLSSNNWNYLTAVKSGSTSTTYLNGVLVGTDSNFANFTNSGALTIGCGGDGSFNGSIDDVMIFNRSLSAQEISALYNSSATKYSNNLTLAQGAHTIKAYAVDIGGNINSTETRTFTIDSQAPTFPYITYSPTSSDDLDPNQVIPINVNVSDTDNNFDSAMIQWKNSTATWDEATNISLELQSLVGLVTALNGSFTLPSYESNITFRIWANDTTGEYNVSRNYTLASFWDCTWTSTSDLGALAGWNNNKVLGNITINNTGDAQYSNNNCTLDFRLNHNLVEGRVYFDGAYYKPSSVYTVSAKASRNIGVNTTFLNNVVQDSLVITTTEVSVRSSTSSRNTTATLVSNQNGPYLYEKITSSPSSVYLTAGNFTLEGYVRNLMGSAIENPNNTAYNVTAYWTIPEGLENLSESLNFTYENLSDNILNSVNALLSFSNLETTTSGIKTLMLSVYGYNSSGDLIRDVNNPTILTESVNITFLCYNESDGIYVDACGSLDGDYVAPESTIIGGSNGGGGGPSSSGKSIKSEANYEILRGENQEFTFDIKNKYGYDMKNIKITVSGLNSQYLDIEPKEIALIPGYGSKPIKIKVNAPSYFNAKNYTLVFSIGGRLDNNGSVQDFTETKYVTLFILDIPRIEAGNMLNDSLKLLEEMNSSSMVMKDAQALFDKINASYTAVDFNALQSNYNSLKSLYDAAFESKKLIEELTLAIAEAENNGIIVTDTKKSLYIAEVIYKRGDYVAALAKLKEAKLTYGLETKGEFNLIYSVKNNPVQAFGIVILAGALGMGGSLLFRFQLYRKRISILKKEEILLLELMKVVQRECFENNKMSMEEYEEAISQYEKRLGQAIQEKIETETKLSNLFKIKGKALALAEEKKKLIEMIKQLQNDYMIEGKVETRIYENMLKSYTSRLGAVDEEIATAEAQSALSSEKGMRRVKLS